MNCFHYLTFLFLLKLAVASRVNLTNNGYSDIVVAISPDVPNTRASELISNIKMMFTKASPILYEATRQRSYFDSVRILVPQHWDNIDANISTWETFKDADVQIDTPNARYGNEPYTLQPGGCGEPGKYILMSPDFTLSFNQSNSATEYGQAEKILIAQWARLRYGVFEEFGKAGNSRYPMFYRPMSSASDTIVPSMCLSENPLFVASDINGGPCKIDPLTGVYDRNCTIQWDQSYQPKSSLMTYPKMESAIHFCDDGSVHPHNREAPTRHNALCDAKSVWSVIMQHDDFRNDRNAPRNISKLEPTFTIVRAEAARFVLIADTSSSMSSLDRINRLNRSASRWIQHDVSDGTKVAMVQFSSSASIVSQLTTINNTSRPILASRVPSTAGGTTCIGCGLNSGLAVLGANSTGGVFLLITDGDENVSPYIREVLPKLIESKVRVVSMAFGRQASDLIEDLALKTDGKSYFINDQGTSDGLSDAFTDSLTYQPAVPSENIAVKLFTAKYINSSTDIRDSFYVDSTVGRNMELRIEYRNRNHIRSVQLLSPNGTVYSSVQYDSSASLGLLQIEDAQEGLWLLQCVVSANQAEYLVVSVTSRTRNANTVPITTECSVLNGPSVSDPSKLAVKIIAEVLQGRNAVIGATVKAYIEKPDSAIEILDLKDDGAFADITADDGIYSRYFVATTQVGRYSVMCQVWGNDSAYVDDGLIEHSARRSAPAGTSTGNFTRWAIGGSFNANNTVQAVDPYPPGRVVDLRIVSMDANDMTVTLRWTAPGEDLDAGTVDRYQIKYSTSFNDVVGDYFVSENATELLDKDVVDGSMVPLEAGSVQIIKFLLPTASQNVTYFFALRAFDASNKTSPTSNVANIQIVLVPEETPTTAAPTTCTASGLFGFVEFTVLALICSVLLF